VSLVDGPGLACRDYGGREDDNTVDIQPGYVAHFRANASEVYFGLKFLAFQALTSSMMCKLRDIALNSSLGK